MKHEHASEFLLESASLCIDMTSMGMAAVVNETKETQEVIRRAAMLGEDEGGLTLLPKSDVRCPSHENREQWWGIVRKHQETNVWTLGNPVRPFWCAFRGHFRDHFWGPPFSKSD